MQIINSRGRFFPVVQLRGDWMVWKAQQPDITKVLDSSSPTSPPVVTTMETTIFFTPYPHEISTFHRKRLNQLPWSLIFQTWRYHHVMQRESQVYALSHHCRSEEISLSPAVPLLGYVSEHLGENLPIMLSIATNTNIGTGISLLYPKLK